MNQTIANINVANDVGAVGGLRKMASEDKAQALRAVAKQFEAIMMQQMLKTSRETTWDDGFGDGEDGAGSGSMDSYREWRDEQLAQTLSTKGSLGLADMLVKQLLPQDKQIPSTAADNGDTNSPMVRKQFNVNAVTSGWWKMPASNDMESIRPRPEVVEVALPSTEEVLLLHNLLQARAKEQSALSLNSN